MIQTLNTTPIPNIHLEELLIGFREIDGEHSGENLAEVVWETLLLYGLIEKVYRIDTDRIWHLFLI